MEGRGRPESEDLNVKASRICPVSAGAIAAWSKQPRSLHVGRQCLHHAMGLEARISAVPPLLLGLLRILDHVY